MEHITLHSIAGSLFQAMDLSCWKDQSLDQIELNSQTIVSQIANLLMQDFILPSRIQQIHQSVDSGHIRCQACGCKLRLHKRDQAIHPKTIFGEKITIKRNQYYCPVCDNYQMVADNQLGLTSHHMTPRLALIAVLCAASWSYTLASAFLCFLFGVRLSPKTCENAVSSIASLKTVPVPWAHIAPISSGAAPAI